MVWHLTRAQGWFRLFGWGLCYRDTRAVNPLFSERQGITKFLTIGHYAVRPLLGPEAI